VPSPTPAVPKKRHTAGRGAKAADNAAKIATDRAADNAADEVADKAVQPPAAPATAANSDEESGAVDVLVYMCQDNK